MVISAIVSRRMCHGDAENAISGVAITGPLSEHSSGFGERASQRHEAVPRERGVTRDRLDNFSAPVLLSPLIMALHHWFAAQISDHGAHATDQ
jgi:hypothetical protein